ncbi:hypothetical protein [Tenacibaculum sp. nBUS_03]|uniref:hypothetical protein n=1 Tax=Tenacibaculum sp. nBUS_03 TaxID=3395320 RepID=UPI003EBB4009
MSAKNLEDLSLDELKALLFKLWNTCQFGVKERFKKYYSHRSVHYILTTPTYSKKSTIIEYIKTLKNILEDIKTEVDCMVKSINESIEV